MQQLKINLEKFKIKEDKTGWNDRNALIGEIMKMTGHSYWAVRNKTKHLSIQKLNSLFLESKNNPKIFYWLLKKTVENPIAI